MIGDKTGEVSSMTEGMGDVTGIMNDMTGVLGDMTVVMDGDCSDW